MAAFDLLLHSRRSSLEVPQAGLGRHLLLTGPERFRPRGIRWNNLRRKSPKSLNCHSPGGKPWVVRGREERPACRREPTPAAGSCRPREPGWRASPAGAPLSGSGSKDLGRPCRRLRPSRPGFPATSRPTRTGRGRSGSRACGPPCRAPRRRWWRLPTGRSPKAGGCGPRAGATAGRPCCCPGTARVPLPPGGHHRAPDPGDGGSRRRAGHGHRPDRRHHGRPARGPGRRGPGLHHHPGPGRRDPGRGAGGGRARDRHPGRGRDPGAGQGLRLPLQRGAGPDGGGLERPGPLRAPDLPPGRPGHPAPADPRGPGLHHRGGPAGGAGREPALPQLLRHRRGRAVRPAGPGRAALLPGLGRGQRPGGGHLVPLHRGPGSRSGRRRRNGPGRAGRSPSPTPTPSPTG